MKILLVVAIVIGAALLFFLSRNRTGPTAQETGKGPEAYAGLRNMILTGSRTKFSLPETSRPTEPWGVVMDWGVQNGTATVVALSDGTASVYLSGGGGFIGGIGQEPIRSSAKAAVKSAGEVQSLMKETKNFPLPQTGQAQFFALTDAGIYTASASEKELAAGRTPFANLGNAMQAVITQYRILQQKDQKPNDNK
jgi:hypothetical protein